MTQISVVIPTYNRPDQLAVCLQSLCNQTISGEAFEVIVVDDGGDMDISPITAPFHQHFTLRLIQQDNSGPAGARNAGVAAATCRFIAFTDDDCLLHENWLLEMLHSLQRHPAALFGGKTINHLEGNIYSNASQALIDHLYDYQARKNPELRFFTSNNMALARQNFLSTGGFDEGFPMASGEDREFCDRWLHHGNALEFVPDAVAYHCHDLNLTRFLELHYRYGKGAKLFWRRRSSRGQDSLSVEKLAFYTSLLAFPWNNKLPSPLSSSCLLALSQLANTAGYFSGPR